MLDLFYVYCAAILLNTTAFAYLLIRYVAKELGRGALIIVDLDTFMTF
jgi:hypothetical protein